MVDAITFAREISYVSANIAEFERLLDAGQIPPADREKVEQSLINLYVAREALRGQLEQVLSVKTCCLDPLCSDKC